LSKDALPSSAAGSWLAELQTRAGAIPETRDRSLVCPLASWSGSEGARDDGGCGAQVRLNVDGQRDEAQPGGADGHGGRADALGEGAVAQRRFSGLHGRDGIGDEPSPAVGAQVGHDDSKVTLEILPVVEQVAHTTEPPHLQGFCEWS
jgi:hypothetical protein